MSKDPAILFYTGDFLNGCTDLTFEERGQYITLLCLQHQKGHLSEKTIRLSVGSVSVDVLKKFSKDENGNYFNDRMDVEIEKRQHFLDTRYFNGKKGGRPLKPNSKPNGKSNSKPKQNLSENDNEDINDNNKGVKILFSDFWELYNKKIGAKNKCIKKWDSLPLETQQKIISTMPNFISSIKDKQFQPYPETYLNQERWNDEIIIIPEKKISFDRPIPEDLKRIMAER